MAFSGQMVSFRANYEILMVGRAAGLVLPLVALVDVCCHLSCDWSPKSPLRGAAIIYGGNAARLGHCCSPGSFMGGPRLERRLFLR